MTTSTPHTKEEGSAPDETTTASTSNSSSSSSSSCCNNNNNNNNNMESESSSCPSPKQEAVVVDPSSSTKRKIAPDPADDSPRSDLPPQQQQQQQKQKQQKRTATTTTTTTKKRRAICARCHRPKPRTCICDSLPIEPIRLKRTRILVLQHPLELKNHKAASHRSLPLLELCIRNSDSNSNSEESCCLELATGRRFGETSIGAEDLARIRDPSLGYVPVLVFPKLGNSNGAGAGGGDAASPLATNANTNDDDDDDDGRNSGGGYREETATVYSLRGLVQKLNDETETETETETTHERTITTPSLDRDNDNGRNEPTPTPTSLPMPNHPKHKKKPKKILLLVLDATWKHAREMHLANIREHQYPDHMLRLALDKDDLGDGFRPGRFAVRGKASKKGYNQKPKPKSKKHDNNYDDNNGGDPPIDESWMSTAECIAWIVSRLEEGSHPKAKPAGGGGDGGDDQPAPLPTGSSPPSPSPTLYEVLVKPLDAVARQWQSFLDQAAAAAASKDKDKAAKKKGK